MLRLNVQLFGGRGADSNIQKTKKIIRIVKAEVDEQSKYNSLKKLYSSEYYVDHIRSRIGKLAFNMNYEITTAEEDEMI